MNEFVIIGAGGLGREIHSWTSTCEKFNKNNVCIGFIDEDKTKLDNFNYELLIIDGLIDNNLKNYSNVLIAINNSKIKQEVYKKVDNSITKIIGFIHNSVILGLNVSFQPCLTVLPNSLISCDVVLGKGVFINNGTQIGHDVVIGDFVNIMANVDIGGDCKIGNNVMIGTGATILPGLVIPNNTTIGAGSVIFRSIKEPGTYVGNPAKKIF